MNSSVPEMYRRQAKALTNYLRNSPVASQRITWDREGHVTVDGMLIPNSNIVDLVNDAVRARKNFKASGRAQFIKGLRAVSVPRTFIGNDVLWNMGNTHIARKRREDDDDGNGDDQGNNEKQRLVPAAAKESTYTNVDHFSKRQKKKLVEASRGFIRWLKL